MAVHTRNNCHLLFVIKFEKFHSGLSHHRREPSVGANYPISLRKLQAVSNLNICYLKSYYIGIPGVDWLGYVVLMHGVGSRYTSWVVIGFLGANFEQSSFSDLEKIYLSKEELGLFYSELAESGVADEVVVLSTCNRLEIYFSAKHPHQAAGILSDQIARLKRVDSGIVSRLLRYDYGPGVLTHLFNVASGCKSLVFGENEILGQIKDAYHIASGFGATGALLNKVFLTAITIGKRVRAETAIGAGYTSVSSLAVDLIREADPDYLNHDILVVGAGVMGVRAIKKLNALGHRRVVVANRDQERLAAAMAFCKAGAIPFSEAIASAHLYRHVVVATAAPSPILGFGDFDRNERLTSIVVDLAMPRNVDSRVGELAGIKLASLEELRYVVQTHLSVRKEVVTQVGGIFEEELQKLMDWYRYRSSLCLANCA